MKGKNYIPALKYDWLTKLYDPLISTFMPEKQFRNALIEQALLKQGSRVLDFGCGSLTLSLLAAERHPKANFHAIDVDEKILTIAKGKLVKSEVQVSLLQYDGSTLPFADGYFDRVVSSLVFHHLTKEQKKRALNEIFRVLKSNGQLHIADWGKAKNVFMRGAFYLVQMLDGFKTTTDNIKGLLPEYIYQAGFEDVTETKSFATILGTLSLYKGIKPKNDGPTTAL